MIEGFKLLSYEERLQRLNLTTLETRRIRADLIETYKIFNGLDRLDPDDFFELSQVKGTRGHRYKIFKKGFRSNLGKYSFGNRVIDEWNSFSESVVLADSLNKFKSILDHHLR